MSKGAARGWMLAVGLVLAGVSACSDELGSGRRQGDCGPNSDCTTTTHTLGPADYGRFYLLCLADGASPADREALFERVQVPSPTGEGTDFREGVVSAAARSHGIAIELSPSITTAQASALLEDLGAEPVAAITQSNGECT